MTDLAGRHELDQKSHFAFARRALGQVFQILEQLVLVGEAAGRVDAPDRVLQLDLRHDHGGEVDQDMLLVLVHPPWLVVDDAERAKSVAGSRDQWGAGVKPDTSTSQQALLEPPILKQVRDDKDLIAVDRVVARSLGAGDLRQIDTEPGT